MIEDGQGLWGVFLAVCALWAFVLVRVAVMALESVDLSAALR